MTKRRGQEESAQEVAWSSIRPVPKALEDVSKLMSGATEKPDDRESTGALCLAIQSEDNLSNNALFARVCPSIGDFIERECLANKRLDLSRVSHPSNFV